MRRGEIGEISGALVARRGVGVESPSVLLPVVDLSVDVTVEDVTEAKQSSSWEYPACMARR